VSILKKFENGNMAWIDGGQTDFNGMAHFNLDLSDTTGTYVVEVNPPWNKSNTLSAAKHEVVGADDIDGMTFALKTPNLFFTVNRADGNGAARWSWVGVEKVNAADNYSFVSWENGIGTNQGGRGAASLDANSTYKLVFYPGFSSAGVRTSCILQTDANGAATKVDGKCQGGTLTGDSLALQLSLGNVTGTVTDATSGANVPGVIVFAERYDGATATGQTFETVTGQNGKYGLQLDPGDWKISFFFAGKTAAGSELVNQFEAVTLTGITQDSSQVVDRVMVRK
jgi:hypothetical protein